MACFHISLLGIFFLNCLVVVVVVVYLLVLFMLYSKIELICPQSCDHRAVLCLNNAFLTSPFAYCQYHVEYGACQPATSLLVLAEDHAN